MTLKKENNMLFGLGGKISVAIALVAIGVGGWSFWMRSIDQETIRELEGDKATLTAQRELLLSINKDNQAVIKEIRDNAATMARNQRDLQRELVRIDQERSRAIILIAEHDLNEMIDQDPKLLERMINDALDSERLRVLNLTDPETYRFPLRLELNTGGTSDD